MASTHADATGVRRLNFGCGAEPTPGWLNADLVAGPGVDIVADVRAGLPLADGAIDYATSIHVLSDLPWPDLAPALRELRRVLRPGGVIRFALPDLDRALAAYHADDRAYFHASDEEARSLGRKLVAQLVWFGVSRTPFTYDFAAEQLARAGFGRVERCAFRRTSSPWPEIVAADNRPDESLFVEAWR